MTTVGILSACLSSIIQAAALAAVIALLLRTKCVAAAVRHRIWFATLSFAVMLPAVDLTAAHGTDSAFTQPPSFGVFTITPQCALVALALWIAVSGFAFARLATSLLQLRRLYRRTAVADPMLTARVAEQARRLGLRQPIDVRTSSDISTPMAIGFLRPAIVLPERLVLRLDDTDRDFVVVHELMHLRRRDAIANVFGKVARAAFVWNPVLHFIERCVAFERERACDEAVVAAFGRPQRYARCLAAVMLFSPAPSAAVPFARSAAQSLRRIELLIASPRTLPRRATFAMASALVAMGVALVAAAYVPQLVALQAPEDAALQIPPSSTAWHAPAASVPSFDSLVPQVKFAAADSVLPAAAGRTFVLNF